MPYLDLIIAGLISFVFGGGAVTLWKAHSENELRKAEAHDLGAKTVPQVTDLSVDTLVKVNAQLTLDYERVKKERDDYYDKFERLRAEVEELQTKLDRAQTDLRAAHEATTALKAQLDSLMESLPTDKDDSDAEVH